VHITGKTAFGMLVFLLLQLFTVPMLVVEAQNTTRNATLEDLMASVSQANLETETANVSRYSRCVTDTGHDQAIEYIRDKLRSYKYLQVETQSFTAEVNGLRQNTRLQNIIARKSGVEPKARHLLVAHLDSSPTRMWPPVCNELAFGANDNASGVAVLLEVARLLNTAQFKDDFELAFFDGEEFGYLGSQHYVNQFILNRNSQLPIDTVINLDMVGYPRDGTTNQTLYAIAQPGDSLKLARLGEELVNNYVPGFKYSVYTIGDLFPVSRDPNLQSDHRNFWNAGIGSAIFFNEDARDILSGDPRYHSPGDTLYKPDGSLRLDPPMMANVTRAAFLIAGFKAGPLPRRVFPAIQQPFEDNWARADRLLATGMESGRSWLWGPQPNRVNSEKYTEADGNSRSVVYFDKARMELTRPATGFVTNGLLVVELTTGRMQVGDAGFQNMNPSRVQVAGDPNDKPGANDTAPTYATFQGIVERGKVPADKEPVWRTLDANGRESRNNTLASYARNVFYVPETGHNIPDVFYNWFGTQGRIYDRLTDSYIPGQLFDWVSAVGLPITEAYWVRAKVGGVEKDVLVQLFERRALTFTPDNPSAFRVEMGNVGQHYLKWRYGS
jgi:hypothetical protein